MGSSRAGLTRVRFGDVVRLVRDRVDPETSGLSRYIAGEHMDTDDLRIRRWGKVGDGYLGPAFHMRFKPGHVLYGSRRTYLRKVAVADFEGICANTTFVLEPVDPSVLLPDILPCVMQTAAFHDHSIKQSKGSVNPYINFSDLAWYEFDLPSIDEQRRLVDIFAANRLVADCYHDATTSAARLFCSRLEDVFARLATDASSPQRALGEIARVERGQFTHRPRNLPQFFGGPYPFVQTGDVAASQGYLQQASQTLSDEGKSYSRSFPRDTILITIAAVIGATAITTKETWCPDSVVGIQPDTNKVRVRYLEFALRHARSFLDGKAATQTAQKNINLAVLRPLPIPVPSLSTQRDIEQELVLLEQTVQAIARRTTTVGDLMRAVNGDNQT
jgi:type I restriction enzyme S subunit